MKSVRSLLVILSLIAGSPAPAGEAVDRFNSIFDGTTLTGWDGEPDYWRVEDGAIVGEIKEGETLDHNTWLIWTGGTLGDFELRLQFKIDGAPAANSGIQFRCQAEDVRHVSGYQADLDSGATWLGRIYDEHGRALLVERGTRVLIDEDGERTVQPFAQAALYETLYRERTWNDYTILASGEHIRVEINGTLFSEMIDRQAGERDLTGHLALQLHSGPHMRVAFRDLRLRQLQPDAFEVPMPASKSKESVADVGLAPKTPDGRVLNLGFEDGSLTDWTAEGDAFQGQPVDEDGIARRWPGQSSNKEGRYFIGGYEKMQDAARGTLTSLPFPLSHPYASYRLGGGSGEATRVEIVLTGTPPRVIHTGTGNEMEEMKRLAVDLRAHLGKEIFVRVVDASSGAWGHVNFDDFRFHEELPAELNDPRPERIRENPLLSHLLTNPMADKAKGTAAETVKNMWLEPGFTAELIAAEPLLAQPIAFTFDELGRLWIAEAHSYPQKRPDGEGLDRIVILEDADGDGSFEKHTVFTEGLNLVSGLEVGHGGVWVGAAPELLFIPDRDRDDRPDGDPVVLLDGFGLQDTHETLHIFVWGPDGWLYGNQGVFNESHIGKPGAPADQRLRLFAGVWRYHPVRHVFEVFAQGGSNQWGLDYDDHGEWFMTHCRSHFGRGATTHVMQGGHYWNQSNSNYAPFVSRQAPRGYPFMQNFLLASAPYGHGEGGAGKPGSRRLYGGHSHVGTMLYLGDNWPGAFRNKLFTHNLHGHQINQQENRPKGSSFETLHAGRDILYCPDQEYIAVDLKYGPDGAVYVIDWADRQHCHNPNEEQWNRGNGRLYRIAYAATWRPIKADLHALSDADLIDLHTHANDWYVRTARRLLHARAAEADLEAETMKRLRDLLMEDANARVTLRRLWLWHAVGGGFDRELVSRLFSDDSEAVKGWTVQLMTEEGELSGALTDAIVELARASATGPLPQRYLASALPRLRDKEPAWQVLQALLARTEAVKDQPLARILWFALAPHVAETPERAIPLAESSPIPELKPFAYWYGAKTKEGVALLSGRLSDALSEQRAKDVRDLLEMMALAVGNERELYPSVPEQWPVVADALYGHDDQRIRQLAESVGASLGDTSLLPRWKTILSDASKPGAERHHAFDMLAKAGELEDGLGALFLALLDDDSFRPKAIQALRRFDDPAIATALIERFNRFSKEEQTLALQTLTTRSAFARILLEAVDPGAIPRDTITAFHARQIVNLDDGEVTALLEKVWGSLGSTPEAVAVEIQRLDKAFGEAPLWAYNAGAGKAHFQKLCIACHAYEGEGLRIGPDLTGSGANGARYFLENILDPNAVVGADFQLTVLETKDGQTLAGLIEATSDTTITLRSMTAEAVTVSLDQIEKRSTLSQSLMPPGLLQVLNEREKIELLKFLTGM